MDVLRTNVAWLSTNVISARNNIHNYMCITTKIAVTVLTFIVGVTAAALWFAKPAQQSADDDNYLPLGVFSPRDRELVWTRKFYSSSLAAMEEPALKDKKNVEVYRFLWLRSFHPPVSVRLWQSGNECYMNTKQLSDMGVPKNDEAIFSKSLAVNKTQSITREEWSHFQELLKKGRILVNAYNRRKPGRT